MSCDEISLVGGGYSARGFDLQRLPGRVIGVNDAGILARCDVVVSMDRMWSEHRWPHLKAWGRETWLRTSAAKAITERPDWLALFDCDHTSAEMSDEPFLLNGTSSGLCALNLAYQQRPKVLRVYGMDMARGPRGEAHWYADYSWAPGGSTKPAKYKAWARDLDRALGQCAAAGIEVIRMVPSKGALS